MASVVGTSYTGSTLLALLLNAHPAIVSVGALNGAPNRVRRLDYPCSCGVLLEQCYFWQRVSEGMHRRGVEFGPWQWDTSFTPGNNPLTRHLLARSLRSGVADRARGRLLARSRTWGGRLEEIGGRNAALLESVTECAGKPILVDTSKDPMRVRFLSGFSGLGQRVIHLVRHPVAFVSSDRRHGQPTVESSIGWWLRRHREILRLQRGFPPHCWLTVRYEDVCTSTEQELARVLEFLGAPTTEDWMGRLPGQEHHVLGNKMRLRWPSEVRMDVSWQRRLSEAEVLLIMARTDRLRHVFGYADWHRLFHFQL